jgi:hypothetical protein
MKLFRPFGENKAIYFNAVIASCFGQQQTFCLLFAGALHPAQGAGNSTVKHGLSFSPITKVLTFQEGIKDKKANLLKKKCTFDK